MLTIERRKDIEMDGLFLQHLADEEAEPNLQKVMKREVERHVDQGWCIVKEDVKIIVIVRDNRRIV